MELGELRSGSKPALPTPPLPLNPQAGLSVGFVLSSENDAGTMGWGQEILPDVPDIHVIEAAATGLFPSG